MTHSPLNDILLIRNQPFEKTKEYLQVVNITIFDNLIAKYTPTEAHQIILYILCAYDEQSPLVIARQDSKTEQDGICEYLNIPEFNRKKLIELQDSYIRIAVTDYVEQFCGEIYRSLTFMKIQLRDYQLAITNKKYYTTREDADSSEKGEAKTIEFVFDWKEMGKAQTQCNTLAKQIQQLEKELKEKVKRMDGIEDLKEFTRNERETGKMRVGRKGNIEQFIK